MPKPAKPLARSYQISSDITYTSRHEQRIPRVLIQHLIRFGVQRIGGDVPNDLIDADESRRTRSIAGVIQLQEKHGFAGHSTRVDGPIKGNRDPRLEVETVQRIDDRDVFTVVWVRAAVGQWEVDTAPREVAR